MLFCNMTTMKRVVGRDQFLPSFAFSIRGSLVLVAKARNNCDEEGKMDTRDDGG